METTDHSIASLFDQLGLDSESTSIEQFIDTNKPIPSNVELHEAPFWSGTQASVLKQMKDDDADWAAVVDQLDAMLR